MAGGVTFELERFGWVDGASALEVEGRWRGAGRRRLGTVALLIEGSSRRRLVSVVTSGALRASPDPSLWRAEFAWSGQAEVIVSAELEVGSGLVIELPAPDGELSRDPQPGERGAGSGELDAERRQAVMHREDAERLQAELTAQRAVEVELRAAAQEQSAMLEAVRDQSRVATTAAGAAQTEADASSRRARDEVSGAYETLRKERDLALGTAERARSDLEETQAQVRRLELELDTVKQRRAQLEREREAGQATLEAVRGERESGLATLEAIRRERDDARDALQALRRDPRRRDDPDGDDRDEPDTDADADDDDTLIETAAASPPRADPEEPRAWVEEERRTPEGRTTAWAATTPEDDADDDDEPTVAQERWRDEPTLIGDAGPRSSRGSRRAEPLRPRPGRAPVRAGREGLRGSEPAAGSPAPRAVAFALIGLLALLLIILVSLLV